MILIDKGALIEKFFLECWGECFGCKWNKSGECGILLDAPTIEASPVKHGRWIEDEYGIPHCSECKAINNTVYRNYCPNCGARMDAQIGEDKSHPFAESVMMGKDEEDL